MQGRAQGPLNPINRGDAGGTGALWARVPEPQATADSPLASPRRLNASSGLAPAPQMRRLPRTGEATAAPLHRETWVSATRPRGARKQTNRRAASQPQREPVLRHTVLMPQSPGRVRSSPVTARTLRWPWVPPCIPMAGNGMVPGGAWELRGHSVHSASGDGDPGLRHQAHRSLAFETLMPASVCVDGEGSMLPRGSPPPRGWPRKPSPAEARSGPRQAAFQERTCQWKSQASGKRESEMR